MRKLLATVLTLAALAGCGRGECNSRYGSYSDCTASADAAQEAAAELEEEARQGVYEERGGDADGTGAGAGNVDADEVEDDGNYACTEGCSGHEAGFAWAQENEVTDAAECDGDSQSFVEGCEAFAEERQNQADREMQEAADRAAEDAGYEE